MTTSHIIVDRSRCTGLGICESIVPERFEVDDSGELIVHDDRVTPDTSAGIEDAVRGCPTSALSLAVRSEQ